MSIGRRHIDDPPVLAKRPWEDVAPELYWWLRKLWDAEADGIPSGFNSVDPTGIDLSDSGTPGTETEGWAAADHEHSVDVFWQVMSIQSLGF